MTRIIRFPASKPPRMTGPEVLDRLRTDEDLDAKDEKQKRIDEGDKIGAVVAGVLGLWILWMATR